MKPNYTYEIPNKTEVEEFTKELEALIKKYSFFIQNVPYIDVKDGKIKAKMEIAKEIELVKKELK